MAASQSCTSASSPASRPVVIGLYGVPGSGKSYLLNQLRQELPDTQFAFFEGSRQIAKLVPGGLLAFQELSDPQKLVWREKAIDTIFKRVSKDGKTGLVTGHVMFWAVDKEEPPVITQQDLVTYTHILYLDIPAKEVHSRRHNDMERCRRGHSIEHLHRWQEAEKDLLYKLCQENNILFSTVFETPQTSLLSKVTALLQDIHTHNEQSNLSRAETMLDDAVLNSNGRFKTIVVLDADRTLAAEDTGTLFWEKVHRSRDQAGMKCPLKTLFSGPMKHSYTAFRQATLLYEEVDKDQDFNTVCAHVAFMVNVHPDFILLLQLVAKQEHVGIIVVTCGLSLVWQKVLERIGLADTVTLIGGGRLEDGIVVTAAVKGALVARLRAIYRLRVFAFGDSPLDLEMLCEANEAIVVVGEENARSRTMDAELTRAIEERSLHARQVLLPNIASLRLNAEKLPVFQLMDPDFLTSLLSRPPQLRFHVIHATDKPAAKLLATDMRNAAVAGPALRDAHYWAGYYLAIEFVADLIGLEDCTISHVLGRRTNGFRLYHESSTLIVALMRGGEPMAFGVNKAFPDASFFHAKLPNDITSKHLHKMTTIILVDSVINSGRTVIEFVQHVRKLCTTVRIVIVAGVVQNQAVDDEGILYRELGSVLDVSLIALRTSKTKFTGRGSTDTGNRLFNTTHLD